MMDPITRLSSDQETGVIVGLETETGRVNLTAGGIEIGNWLGFFSQESGKGVNAEVKKLEVSRELTAVETCCVVELPEAVFKVRIAERLEQGTWIRETSATALRTSWIGDFVLRLGVHCADFPTAGDGKHHSAHKGRNTYHQFPVDTVEMNAEGRILRTSQRDDIEKGRLNRVSYWRDQQDGQWIQHHRLIVGRADLDHVVLRMRNTVLDTRDTRWLRSPLLRAPFWALNEDLLSHLPFRILPTLQAQGVICMAEGETIKLASNVRIDTVCDGTNI